MNNNDKSCGDGAVICCIIRSRFTQLETAPHEQNVFLPISLVTLAPVPKIESRVGMRADLQLSIRHTSSDHFSELVEDI